jgi:hypothetical protein
MGNVLSTMGRNVDFLRIFIYPELPLFIILLILVNIM